MNDYFLLFSKIFDHKRVEGKVGPKGPKWQNRTNVVLSQVEKKCERLKKLLRIFQEIWGANLLDTIVLCSEFLKKQGGTLS